MREPRLLELEGHDGLALPAVLFESAGARRSAVVLPGGSRAGYRLGGTPARPDLNYTRALLLAHEISVLELWWSFDGAPDGERGEEWLERNAEAAVQAAGDVAPVGVLVARSVGTRALAKLARRREWAATPTIWLAPLIRHPEVRAVLEDLRAPAFVVGGTRDELFDLDAVSALRAHGAAVVLVEGGNHALEVGRPAGSARALADVLDAMDAFVSELELPPTS